MEFQTSEIDPGGFKPSKFRWVHAFFLLGIVFFLGVQFGHYGVPAAENAAATFLDRGRQDAQREADWQLLWDAIDTINEQYVDRPADMLKILYGAVSGAAASLQDPYSVFLPPQQATEFQEELAGNFEGIGAEIAIKHQQLVIVSPLDDSPAEAAGLRGGDAILKIDGEDSVGLTLEQAVGKIRGQAGTQVTLSVYRQGQDEPRDYTITRAKIEVKSLSFEIKEHSGKKIGYIELRRFGEDTKGKFDQAVTELLVANVAGVVLDLRNNPGGYLETAVEIASNWVSEGEVVVIQEFASAAAQGSPGEAGDERPREEMLSEGRQRLAGVPTVVLVNGGSASASEIVAGALQDYGLAKLVGEKTFGKGSVQQLIDLRAGAEIKITVAKWLTPKGHDLNKEGLAPDEKVELSDEDFQNDRDPQLDRALEMFTQ